VDIGRSDSYVKPIPKRWPWNLSTICGCLPVTICSREGGGGGEGVKGANPYRQGGQDNQREGGGGQVHGT
jgi:hypothetical protein